MKHLRNKFTYKGIEPRGLAWLVVGLRYLPALVPAFFVSITYGQPMSLEQAVKQGLDNNRELKISSYKVSLAETRYKEAVDLTLPSLKATAGYTRQSDLTPPAILLPGFPEPVTLFPIYV